jgi:hypothetical protein
MSIVMRRLVAVDHKVRSDMRYPAGFMGPCNTRHKMEGKGWGKGMICKGIVWSQKIMGSVLHQQSVIVGNQ